MEIIRKEPIIELMEFNFLMSLMDFFNKEFKDKEVHGKKVNVVQSYSDRHIPYISPAFSVEILHRKNRSIGFNNYYGELKSEDNIIEVDGTLLEYRVQLNVYSNTRGENHKWNSILDEILIYGSNGIPLNTYNDDASIKKSNIGIIDYDYSSDVKNNNMTPNAVSYDFHAIYEVKMMALQKYVAYYDIMEIDKIIGSFKNNEVN